MCTYCPVSERSHPFLKWSCILNKRDLREEKRDKNQNQNCALASRLGIVFPYNLTPPVNSLAAQPLIALQLSARYYPLQGISF